VTVQEVHGSASGSDSAGGRQRWRSVAVAVALPLGNTEAYSGKLGQAGEGSVGRGGAWNRKSFGRAASKESEVGEEVGRE